MYIIIIIESASGLPIVSVVPECQSEWWALKYPSTSESVPDSMWSSGGEITPIAGAGQGDVHVGDEQLFIIHSDVDGQLFLVGVIL